jgi:protein SCO1/2
MHESDPVQLERRRVLGCLLALGGVGAMPAARAGETKQVHDHAGHATHADHSAHQAAAANVTTQRREAAYQIPAVTMLDQRGRKQLLSKALDDGRPVMLNFIFTSCYTICPVMTQVFVQVQEKLAGEAGKIHMVSVSIDPEFDTSARLLAYSQQHRAGPQWDFYTGSIEASVAVQKAFDAYRGDKMNHVPMTVLRGPRRSTWDRFDGFASPDNIVAAYRALAA